MDTSLYIHIPFCRHRCAYCDFNTYAGQEDSIPAYVDALCREIELAGQGAPSAVALHTVFFGGGTPSLLTPQQLLLVLDAIRSCFALREDAEITIEANPGTVSAAGLAELRAAGINRISFGAQSANGEELRMLERAHSFLDVMEAVTNARRAGFDNLNLDLIYGLPEQRLETWQTTVRRVLDLHPEHLSAYALTLEHGTPFGRWSARGLLPMPDPDAAAEMYEWASDALEASGYEQYEISNWALKAEGTQQPERACRHNLQYWRSLPYLGLGAGAHGYAGGSRYSNVLRIKTYIDRMSADPVSRPWPLSPAAVNQHRQTIGDDMSEFMITGLRLTRDGIGLTGFRARFGREVHDIYGKQIDELTRTGLLELVDGDTLRLTKRGRLLGNRVFVRFV